MSPDRIVAIEGKQVANLSVIVDGNVQVDGRNCGAAVPSGIADLSQTPASRQSVADERVPAVVNCQVPGPLNTKHGTCPLKSQPQCVARQGHSSPMRQERADESFLAIGIVRFPLILPSRNVRQGSSIPPKRHSSPTSAFAHFPAYAYVWAINADTDVVKPQRGDF